MRKIRRDKRTGDYYTPDKMYRIEKGSKGWNVNEYACTIGGNHIYKYSFSCDTLKEVRESL